MISRLFHRQVSDNSIELQSRSRHWCARKVADDSVVTEKQANAILKKGLANLIRQNLNSTGIIESEINYRSVLHHSKIELALDKISKVGTYTISINDKGFIEDILYARHPAHHIKSASTLLMLIGFITMMIGGIKDKSLEGELQYAGMSMMGIVLLLSIYALINVCCTTDVEHTTSLTASEVEKFSQHLATKQLQIYKIKASLNTLTNEDINTIKKTLTQSDFGKLNPNSVKKIIQDQFRLTIPEEKHDDEYKLSINI